MKCEINLRESVEIFYCVVVGNLRVEREGSEDVDKNTIKTFI